MACRLFGTKPSSEPMLEKYGVHFMKYVNGNIAETSDLPKEI